LRLAFIALGKLLVKEIEKSRESKESMDGGGEIRNLRKR
jgi:hypothetical protein